MRVSLNFRIYSYTIMGEQIAVVGDIKQLGEWNPNKGLYLKTNPEIYPLWVGYLEMDIEPYSLVQFKLVIASGNQVKWEETDNRVLEIQYQYTNIVAIYNAWVTKIIRVKSFFDLTINDNEDSISPDFIYAKKRHIHNCLNPLEDEQNSSESETENSFDSLFELDSKENIKN